MDEPAVVFVTNAGNADTSEMISARIESNALQR